MVLGGWPSFSVLWNPVPDQAERASSGGLSSKATVESQQNASWEFGKLYHPSRHLQESAGDLGCFAGYGRSLLCGTSTWPFQADSEGSGHGESSSRRRGAGSNHGSYGGVGSGAGGWAGLSHRSSRAATWRGSRRRTPGAKELCWSSEPLQEGGLRHGQHRGEQPWGVALHLGAGAGGEFRRRLVGWERGQLRSSSCWAWGVGDAVSSSAEDSWNQKTAQLVQERWPWRTQAFDPREDEE